MKKPLILFLLLLFTNTLIGQDKHFNTFTLINDGKGTDVNDNVTFSSDNTSLTLLSKTFKVENAIKTGRNELYNDTSKGKMIASEYKTSYYKIILMDYVDYPQEVFLKIVDLVDGENYIVRLHNRGKVSNTNKNDSTDSWDKIYDTRKIKENAQIFFDKYIAIRLLELDEDGYATEYKDSRGDFEVGDINSDDIPDVIVTYTVEGIGGGNNWSRHIMLMTTNGEKIIGFNNDFLYDDMQKECVFLGIQNGYANFRVIDVSYSDEVEKPRIESYGIRNNELVKKSR